MAAALVNSSNQVGGALGAALLNTIAASTAAKYLIHNAPRVSPQTAVVHGDVIAFTFLIVMFAAGAVITALLFPRHAQTSSGTSPGRAVS